MQTKGQIFPSRMSIPLLFTHASYSAWVSALWTMNRGCLIFKRGKRKENVNCIGPTPGFNKRKEGWTGRDRGSKGRTERMWQVRYGRPTKTERKEQMPATLANQQKTGRHNKKEGGIDIFSRHTTYSKLFVFDHSLFNSVQLDRAGGIIMYTTVCRIGLGEPGSIPASVPVRPTFTTRSLLSLMPFPFAPAVRPGPLSCFPGSFQVYSRILLDFYRSSLALFFRPFLF